MLAVGGGPGCPEEMSEFPEVLAVFGPTASGKSEVADALARRLATEVVSADALQVYRGLPILTNQPASPTRLVAIRELAEEMSVGEYARLAHEAIDELVGANGAAVVAGGTGLYLRAALADMRLPPAPPAGARDRWDAAYDADPAAAYARLTEVDPRAAAVVHASDRRRVVRALELAELGASLAPESDRLWSEETRRQTLVAGLDVPVETLEARIEARAEAMLAARRRRGGARRAHSRHLAYRGEGTRPPRAGRATRRRGAPAARRADAPLRRVPAEVDATHPRHRHDRRRPAPDRGGG